MKNVIVFDSDLGTDDAMALSVWGQYFDGKPDFISAGFGNTTLENACLNAALIRKYFHASGKIVVGAGPLGLKNDSESSTFHGSDGLADIQPLMLEKMALTEEEKAFLTLQDFREELRKADSITWVGVGPLTTLELMLQDQEIRGKIDRLLIMGGGFTEFNCGHNTEFNFSKNPMGVEKVLKSGIDLTLFPLDLTNHQNVFDEDIALLEASGNYPEAVHILRFNKKSNTEFDGIPAAVMHDVMPVLYLAEPEKFTVKDIKVVSDEYGATLEREDGVLIHVVLDAEEGTLMTALKKVFGI